MGAHDSSDSLSDIRRAAFELRGTDPAEAVRILRRAVKKGGEAEALAHGALAEILLDEFDDVDGAIHHFEKLLKLAPGLPAGELGLARSFARNGELDRAQTAYRKALDGFEKQLRDARAAGGDELPPGLEESVLTALELAIEERQWLGEQQLEIPAVTPDRELLDWAEESRIFDPGEDDEPEDLEDWIRYGHQRGQLLAMDGDLAGARAFIDRVADKVPLPPLERARLRSLVSEAGGDLKQAADEAVASLGDLAAHFDPDAVFRADWLLGQTGRAEEGRALLERLKTALESWAPAQRDGEARRVRDEVLAEVNEQLRAPGRPGLVSLGLGRRGQKP